MKCPKCGYNSFEYLDSCKKCNNELSGFKASHGIRAVVLPFRPLEMTTAPAEERIPVPQASAAAETDDAMFSWHSEPADPSPSGAGEFPLAFGESEPEAEPFSFDLDLPLATPEEGERGLALEDLGGESGLSLEETYSEVEQHKEEQSQPEDTPFGDFSFDDLYKQETKQEEPESPVSGFIEPGAADADPVVAGPAEFSFDDLESNETPATSPAETTDFAQPSAVLELDEFPFEQTSMTEAAELTEAPGAPPEEEEAFDSMGLSAEEYESLFGEAPPKKKSIAH